LLYNSTINVSFTGTSISSLAGIDTIFPSKFSVSAVKKFGNVFGFSANTLNFSVVLLFSETVTTSLADTSYDGISTFLPFTKKCP
jgi:hypothetical protein